MKEKFGILIKISRNSVPKCPIDNTPTLDWIMACHQIGTKPLSKPILIRFTDAFMRHKGEMS